MNTGVARLTTHLRCLFGARFEIGKEMNEAWSTVLAGYPFELMRAACDEHGRDRPTFPPTAYEIERLLGGRAEGLIAKAHENGWAVTVENESLKLDPSDDPVWNSDDVRRRVGPHKPLLLAYLTRERFRILPDAAPVALIEGEQAARFLP